MPQDLPSARITLRAALINALLGVSVVAVCLAGWAAFCIGRMANSVNVPDLSPTFAKVNQALDTVNRPCAPGPCGTLAEINKSVAKVGDVIVTTQMEERTIAPHTIQAMDTLKETASTLSGTASGITETTQAAAQALQQAQTDLQTANHTIAAAQPVMANITASSADLDAFLKGKMLTETLPAIALNLQTTTGNFSATTADVRSQVYKWTHPSKKKLTFWTATEAGGDYARHFMPSLF